jgi:hypothetical protein
MVGGISEFIGGAGAGTCGAAGMSVIFGGAGDGAVCVRACVRGMGAIFGGGGDGDVRGEAVMGIRAACAFGVIGRGSTYGAG